VDVTPLCVLLLPSALEDSPHAAQATDLLRAPAIVAVEPARLSYRRRSEIAADMLAATQARRLIRKLPGIPRVVVLFDTLHYPLGRALAARSEGCELWYGVPDEPEDDRLAFMHDLASQRATLRFGPGDPAEPAFRHNGPLWDRLEELGIARR
jgi:hypothetical protein